MNQVNVLCKLPSGIVLELGLVMDYQLRKFVQTPAYKRVVLKGAQGMMNGVIQTRTQDLPASADFIPSVTPVDEEFAREWFRVNAKNYWVRIGALAIIEKPADAKSQIADATQVKTGFEPLNLKEDPRARAIGGKVEKYFNDDGSQRTGWEQRR